MHVLEDKAVHRGTFPDLDDRPLGGRESVEPGGDQRLDRRRDRCRGSTVVDHHGDDLLDEQRIAVGDVQDVLRRAVVELLRRDQLVEELARVCRGERLDENRIGA